MVTSRFGVLGKTPPTFDSRWGYEFAFLLFPILNDHSLAVDRCLGVTPHLDRWIQVVQQGGEVIEIASLYSFDWASQSTYNKQLFWGGIFCIIWDFEALDGQKTGPVTATHPGGRGKTCQSTN